MSMKTALASSQPFGSLVKRSIEAWKLLSNRRGKTQAIKKHSQVLRRLSSLDDFLNFRDRQYWFFQLRESFLRQKAFQKWDPDRLEDYILLPVEDGFVNETDCIFISHYWRARGQPDQHGEDLRPLQQRLHQGFWDRAAYFWVDFTCMPQWERTEPQQQYFTRALRSIPRLVRDCTFAWRFPDFQPRLWVLFEAAGFTWNRSRPIPLADIEPFMKHLREMKGYGVRYVLNRHGYRCTNQGDRELVVGWLEMLLTLSRILPSIRIRLAILNAVDNSRVRTCHHQESGITVDKLKGTITMNERTYEFTPVAFEVTGSDAHVHIEPDSYYEKQLPKALQRAENAPDDRGYEEIGREYDREGEYKIGEVLHRKSLADKENARNKSVPNILVGLYFLAENLENQGRYEEAEELWRRNVTMGEEEDGPHRSSTLKSRERLAMVVQKRKLATYYQRWKLEPLEKIIELGRPNIPESGQSDAMISGSGDQKAKKLENEERFNEAKMVLWLLLERRKETLGPYHLHTLTTMCDLARVLRREGNSAASERLFWLALAVSDDRRGPEHPYTLAIMSNLAASMITQGKEVEAKEIYRDQLERQLRSVDFDHPDTFTVKFNLMQSLDKNEELQIAGSRVQLRPNRRVEGR
jgi:tetratricopeptide (TPR) repeat protein